MSRETPAAISPAALATHLLAAPRLLIMLDYDGTLAPIAPTPEAAAAPPAVLAALGRLLARPGARVAVVSGRELGDLERRLPLPGLWLVGEHGAVCRPPGGQAQWAVDPVALRAGLEECRRRAALVVRERPGWYLERKAATLAVHYRLAPPREGARLAGRIRELWAGPASRFGLELLAGQFTLEVRPRGTNKGHACQRLMAAYPQALPLYAGDEATDEDAFRAVNAAGGVTVLALSEPQPSAARYHLGGPAQVAKLLDRLAANPPGPPVRQLASGINS